MQVHIWDKSGVTGPNRAGAVEPSGAADPAGAAGPAGVACPTGATGLPGTTGPTPCHVLSLGDHHFHKHTLYG
jgi:hypothetical protein